MKSEFFSLFEEIRFLSIKYVWWFDVQSKNTIGSIIDWQNMQKMPSALFQTDRYAKRQLDLENMGAKITPVKLYFSKFKQQFSIGYPKNRRVLKHYVTVVTGWCITTYVMASLRKTLLVFTMHMQKRGMG